MRISSFGWVVLGGCLALIVGAFVVFYRRSDAGVRTQRVWSWLGDASAHPEWAIMAGQRCGSAPFLLPTDGFVGFLWDDTFRVGHRHQGIDIFGGGGNNVTPVIAAYPGYLTRQADWRSAVIVRVPSDPLHPGKQIWLYYTHMADEQGNSFIDSRFSPGTSEVFIEAGTLLGYQGNYSGDPNNPVGVHLHFSIVRDDGRGGYLNELEIDNTLDPSPYLGLPLNAARNRDQVPVCAPAS
jgi:hypothetical protein